jgi:hypothetical protein
MEIRRAMPELEDKADAPEAEGAHETLAQAVSWFSIID